ncbi:MAG TPA: type II CAAX endopeptidase family protein [Bacteroidales bacterium]|nr:type II CAAX endopeptidase family protein [Bacteroidales bacterium]
MKDYLKYYRPKLGESWLIMLAILLVAGSIFTGAIVFITNLIHPDLLSLTGSGWSTPIVYVLPFLVVFLYIYLRSRQSFYVAVRADKPPYPDPPAKLGKVPVLLFILLLPVIIVAMSFIMDPLTEWLEMPEFIKDLFEKMTESNLPTFLAIVIAAPLLEEWLLRAVALKGMLQHMDPWKAIAWSALMFGIIHFNPWQAIPAFLMGCLFGWIYYRTRSYWTCVALHAINNGLSFLLAGLFPEMSADASIRSLMGNTAYFTALVCSVLILSLVIYYLHKKLAPAPDLTPYHERNESVPADL